MSRQKTVTSLKQSLYRLVFIPALLMLSMIVGVMVFSNQLVFREIRNEQTLVVETISRLSWQYLDETQILLRSLAAVLIDLSPSDRDRLLNSVHASYPRFTALYVLDSQGRVLNESKPIGAPSLLRFDLSGESYFKAARLSQQTYFSTTFFSIFTGDIAVTVAQPMFDANGFVGMLVGELDLGDLQITIQRMLLRPKDLVFIVDERGTVVAHPNRDLVRQQVNMSELSIVRDGFKGPTNSILSMDSVWMLASAAPMQNGWVVVTSRPLWEAAAPLLWLAGVSFSAFLVSLFIFVWGVQRDVRRISAPISRLAEKAISIAQGHYAPLDDTITHGRYHELNVLTSSFNQMVETIRARTSELLEANRQLQVQLEERLRVESALRESEGRYRSLFENTPISIWEEDFSEAKRHLDQFKEKFNGDWQACLTQHPSIVAECAERVRVLAVNQATLKLHGAESAEQLLKRLSEIFTVESPVTFARELEAIWYGRAGVEVEGRIRTLKGEIRYVIVRWSVLPDHRQAYDRVLLSLADITPHKTAEMELQKHREHLEELVRERTEKLERANQELESFAYTVSHDLRAPLRHIDGYSNILSVEYADQLDEQGRFFISNVRKAAQNMSRMIDGLLQLSRTSRGTLTYTQVDLSAL
ncbi:MAG: cache domain-containing protein, partial [Anaerolineales bacterium]